MKSSTKNAQNEEVKKKTFLISPNLLREMENYYKKLKTKPEATARIKIIDILSKANRLVQNIDSLMEGNIKARILFNTYLIDEKNEITFPDLKEEQTKEKLKEKIIFCFELNNLIRLNLITAKYWLLKKDKWKKAQSNLIDILKSLQTIQNDVLFLEDICKNKKDISYVDFPKKISYVDFSKHQYFLSGFNIWEQFCRSMISRVFSPEPGGLYHISQITDIHGNDIFSKVVCKNEIIILKGDFTHNNLPQNVFVVVPTEVGFSYAEIIEWTRTEIKIKLPQDSKQGCIFIYDFGAELEYNNCINNEENNITEFLEKLDETDEKFSYEETNEKDFDNFFKIPKSGGFQSQFEPPECYNYPGYKPIIENIKINGEEPRRRGRDWKPVRVWNEEEVEIKFEGKLVEDVFGDSYKGWRLAILTDYGMVLVNVGLNANVTSYKFTPHLEQTTEFTIILKATNRCLIKTIDSIIPSYTTTQAGPVVVSSSPHPQTERLSTEFIREHIFMTVDRVTETRKMIVQKKPRLKIVGIEATQGIQRFRLPISENITINDNIRFWNNSVDLIKNRTTFLRVYIDSGIETPVIDGDLVTVNGTVDYGEGYLYQVRDFVARSKFNLDRDIEDHSLNFIIPGFFLNDDTKTFSFRVFHPGRESEDGFEDSISMTLDFKTGYSLSVFMVLYDTGSFSFHGVEHGNDQLINDDGREDYEIRFDAIDLLTTYLPVPDDGIELRLPLLNDRHKTTYHDLETGAGWNGILDELGRLTEGYEGGTHLLWLGLVPTNTGYPLAGKGTAIPFLSRVQSHAVAQSDPDSTIPHEIGHTLDIGHTYCNEPPNSSHVDHDEPENIETHLSGRTHYPGIAFKYHYWYWDFNPANCGDLMSYCHEPRWTSCTTWEYLYEKIKDGGFSVGFS